MVAAPLRSTSFAAIVGSRVAGVDYLFTTDNQYTQGMYRLEYDGAPLQSWGSAGGNAAPLAMFGAVVVWGNQSATYRASTGTAGTTTVMNVGPARVYTGALGPSERGGRTRLHLGLEQRRLQVSHWGHLPDHASHRREQRVAQRDGDDSTRQHALRARGR